MEEATASIERHFGDITDPRIDRTKLHKLLDILVIALCAIVAGADSWEDVAEFGQAKVEWFKKFLEIANGIPSHDTFNRVFARIDPLQFQDSFMRWISAVSTVISGQVIAIDGKVLRRSQDRGVGKAAIDMVRTYPKIMLSKICEQAMCTNASQFCDFLHHRVATLRRFDSQQNVLSTTQRLAGRLFSPGIRHSSFGSFRFLRCLICEM